MTSTEKEWRDHFKRYVSGWIHSDGSVCDEYWAPTSNVPEGGYWCTAHQMFVAAPPQPEPLVLEMRPVRLRNSPLYGCRRCHVLAVLHLWRLYRRHLRHLHAEKLNLIPTQLPSWVAP